jgi:hypothetical protein
MEMALAVARSFLLMALALALPVAWADGGVEAGVIAVIVARAGPEQTLDKSALNRIFLRKTGLWANGEPIRPVNLSAAHPLRRLFSQRVAGLEPEDLEDYWNDQYFHGIFPPYAVASEEAAIRYVAESAAAIGYVSACAADERVKVLFYLTAAGVVPGGSATRFCPSH